MQVIPNDWQSKISCHIVTMSDAFNRAQMARDIIPGGPVAASFQKEYERTCHSFTDYIETQFNSMAELNEFLKADAHAAAREKGLGIAINAEKWGAWPTDNEDRIQQAQMMAETYKSRYQAALRGINTTPGNQNIKLALTA